MPIMSDSKFKKAWFQFFHGYVVYICSLYITQFIDLYAKYKPARRELHKNITLGPRPKILISAFFVPLIIIFLVMYVIMH